jgi:hypothetical protein
VLKFIGFCLTLKHFTRSDGYFECVSVRLWYPALNAHAQYCHLWPAPPLQYFPTLSHKRYDFRGKVTEHKMCVLIFCTTLSEKISLSKNNCARYDKKNVYWSSRKVPVILVRFWWDMNFPDIISKNTQISNLMKIRPVGTELFHSDGRTDMTELIYDGA